MKELREESFTIAKGRESIAPTRILLDSIVDPDLVRQMVFKHVIL